MKHPPQTIYWQLDVFVAAMIGLLIAAMRAHVSGGWAAAVAVAWSALTIAGMAVWVWANWAALQHGEQRTMPLKQRIRR